VKDKKSELTKIQKHRDDVLKELDKVKQDQDNIEKKCSKLCELKDNVIYFFSISWMREYYTNVYNNSIIEVCISILVLIIFDNRIDDNRNRIYR